jgi:hypothetical protein
MKSLFTSAILAAAICLSPVFVKGADEKPADDAKKARGMPFNGKVSAVDKTAKTITLEGKERNRTFQLTAATKINKDKKPITLEEVTVGDHVGGYARENAEGKLEVVTLNTGLPPRASKAKDEKKEEKK